MLKIKITRSGFLEIKRNQEFKPQYCCYRQAIKTIEDTVYRKCGDWCPLFGEPEDIRGKNMRDQRIIGKSIQLCHQAKLTGHINDNRGQEE